MSLSAPTGRQMLAAFEAGREDPGIDLAEIPEGLRLKALDGAARATLESDFMLSPEAARPEKRVGQQAGQKRN